MSGDRVQIEQHDYGQQQPLLRSEGPISVPTVGPMVSIARITQANSSQPADLATCSNHVCTQGWRLKFGLQENQPCETTPCTEVECCELFQASTQPPAPAPPAPPAPPCASESPPVIQAAKAAVPPAALGGIAVGGCILGCYLGRKWTQFQEWRRKLREEKQEEEMMASLAEEEAAAAAAAAAAGKKKKGKKGNKKGGGEGGEGDKQAAAQGEGEGAASSASAAAPAEEGGAAAAAEGEAQPKEEM